MVKYALLYFSNPRKHERYDIYSKVNLNFLLKAALLLN